MEGNFEKNTNGHRIKTKPQRVRVNSPYVGNNILQEFLKIYFKRKLPPDLYSSYGQFTSIYLQIPTNLNFQKRLGQIPWSNAPACGVV